MKVAQCLLNYRDFDSEHSKINTINTVNVLLENHYIPIFNENDTVATEEIQFGDNDKLAAMTAKLLTANLLILASDIDGLYNDDPKQNPHAQLIEVVHQLEKVKSLAADSLSAHGTGGMKSKLEAAEICQKAGVEMWIVNGGKENFMVEAMRNAINFTKFVV